MQEKNVLASEDFFGDGRHMKTASDIIDTIGAERVMSAVGVKKRRIDQARQDGRLPASWYHILEEMTGEALPRRLFTFKGIDR
jgi:hypothetical protein